MGLGVEALESWVEEVVERSYLSHLSLRFPLIIAG